MTPNLRSSLKFWWKAIKADSRLVGSPPAPSFELVDDPSLHVAQIKLLNPPAIEVASSFVDEVQSEIQTHLSDVCQAVLFGLDFDHSDPIAGQYVSKALLEQATSFVNLHELFHILSGHIDDLKQRKGQTHYGEASLGMAKGTAATEEEIDESYYREFEADDCAIQCMTQLPMQEEIIDFLTAIEIDDEDGLLTHRLMDSEGIPKMMGFRVVGVAAWLIIRLIESKREKQIQEAFDDHPLPEARLLSCLTTLQEEYADLSAEVVDGEERRTVETTDEQSRRIVEFAEWVMKPMMLQLPPMYESGDRLPLGLLEIGYDMNSLMFGGEMQTDAGREVLRLQSMRSRMEARLQPLRYYE